MSDLESRVGDGLAGTAGRAPHPTDLASGARVRLRRRRRTTTGVVAAALVVAAVPVGLSVLGPSDDPPDRPTGANDVGAPGSGRTETWRDLSVSVPPEWRWGGGRGWCADGGTLGDSAQVSRPGGVVPAIACTPSYGYGAHFQEPSVGELPPGTEGAVQQYRGDRYPDGSWIGYVATQASAVWVVAEDRSTARQVLDSATPVGEVDANGCATRLEMSAYSAAKQVSVCRYDAGGWLEQSELLDAAESARAVKALTTSPRTDGGQTCQPGPGAGVPVIVMHGAGVDAQVALEGPCRGVDDNADDLGVRELTPDVLYWALSPGWSGSFSLLSYGDDPEPLQLRTE